MCAQATQVSRVMGWGAMKAHLYGTKKGDASCIIDDSFTKDQAEEDGAAVLIQHLQHRH